MPAECVDLFIAGVQKSATSTLHAYLAEHPDIKTADEKELHFFDDESQDWSSPPYDQLHAHFLGEQRGRLALDATPIYIFWPQALERIQAYNPTARLILTFRDPIARAWSHWRMETQRHAERMSFSDAIRHGRARLNRRNLYTHYWRVHSYVERGFYARQLKHALTVFPKEQMLLLNYEEVTQHPQSAMGKIVRFCGVSPHQIQHEKHVLSGPDHLGSIGEEDTQYLRSIYQADTQEFAKLSGLDTSTWPTLNPDVPVL